MTRHKALYHQSLTATYLQALCARHCARQHTPAQGTVSGARAFKTRAHIGLQANATECCRRKKTMPYRSSWQHSAQEQCRMSALRTKATLHHARNPDRPSGQRQVGTKTTYNMYAQPAHVPQLARQPGSALLSSPPPASPKSPHMSSGESRVCCSSWANRAAVAQTYVCCRHSGAQLGVPCVISDTAPRS